MKNLKNLILEPSKLFQSLKDNPSWLMPFIIVSVVGIILAILMQPAHVHLSTIRLQETLSPDQVDAALQRAKRLGLMGLSLLPFITLIRWAIIGGLILIIAGLFTEKLNFKQSFSIISYTNLIVLLGSAVNTGAVYLKGVESISSPYDLWLIGLNFWSQETVGLPLYLFLSEITVFSVWYVILITIGLITIADLSKGKAAFVSIFVWLLGAGIKIGIALIGTQFSPAG